jgi:NTP pyrophosphatase (non-canonical NTP hydrolase)
MDLEHVSAEVEQVSQIYAEKFGIERDATWFLLKLQEEVGELTQSYLMLTGNARAKGKSPEEIQAEFHKEVADVFCHTLLLARFYGIDLEKEVEEKWLAWRQ